MDVDTILWHDLIEAELLHDKERARRLYASLPEQRQGATTPEEPDPSQGL